MPNPTETSVSHTPGPWRIETVQFSGEKHISYGVKADSLPGFWIYLPTTHEGNARLIASAPDLLAVLSDLRMGYGLNARGRQLATAAIAKATRGES